MSGNVHDYALMGSSPCWIPNNVTYLGWRARRERDRDFSPSKIYEHEIRIIGSNSCANKFAAAVEVMSNTRDRAAVLLGESFPIWDFAAEVDSMVAGHAAKIQLRFT